MISIFKDCSFWNHRWGCIKHFDIISFLCDSIKLKDFSSSKYFSGIDLPSSVFDTYFFGWGLTFLCFEVLSIRVFFSWIDWTSNLNFFLLFYFEQSLLECQSIFVYYLIFNDQWCFEYFSFCLFFLLWIF